SRPMRRAAAVLVAFLALSGCTRGDARARLQDDIQADTIDIIHARFPCRSPDLHFFGYRFRVIEKGEYGDGDICWNISTRQWSWRILPGQGLLRPQPSQLASTVASTKKSLLANLRILGGRAQPSPNGIPVGRKIMKSAQDHALPAPVIGRADGGLSNRTTMLQDE